jgi:streptogramin lyase
MKKHLFIIALVLLAMAAVAVAAPFLVADPQEAAKYRIRLSADNGANWGAWVEGPPVNGALRFDIAGTPAGNYTGEAQAGGDVSVTDSTTGQVSTVFMWSTSAPFLLTVRPGQAVVNIRVIAE